MRHTLHLELEGTTFAHGSETKLDRGSETASVELADVADRVAALGNDAIVLTGDEPMIRQRALAALPSLVERRLRTSVTVDIETNGTILPSAEFDEVITRFVVSPKLGNARMAESLRIKPDVIRFFAEREGAFFKFVAGNDADVEEIEAPVHGLRHARSR